ncbi:hypothetical protein EYY60_08020 [Flavobacterium zhairuonense]|uniref:hypothetical protein n=1 Tax=Flavobacterium zhairuonense TaxID=2493631 RepID=UPI001042D291|nr:hypothetical protein [Flavobacterium zhairuonense]KAF2511368.1 hypothetical protein EYY60_08020 [Flavobacterium zhairuonense]
MKSSFAILVLISILSCHSNTNNEKKRIDLSEKKIYGDIDFINMKGVKLLGNDLSKVDAYFEINKNENNVEIISYVKSQSLNKNSNDSVYRGKEVFIKKNGGYYFHKEWIDEDNPEEKMKREIFIINNKLLKVENVIDVHSKKKLSSKVEKIDLVRKEIETLKFYNNGFNVFNEISFDKLIKSEKPYSYTKTLIKPNDFGLLLEYNVKNFQNNTQEQYQEKYTGYPKKQLNNYWNLYKKFYGDEM